MFVSVIIDLWQQRQLCWQIITERWNKQWSIKWLVDN